MKKVIPLIVSVILCSACFSQSLSSYNQYMKNLCKCYQQDTLTINSMNDASTSLGQCMNSIDTSLRNKAMKEKNIFKTGEQDLIQFEKLFAMDLLKECAAFQSDVERLSNNTEKRPIAKLPVLDTIAKSTCNCLELKGVSSSKTVATANITDCLNSSVLKSFDELIKQYGINDDNQQILSLIGDEISKMVMTNCKFYLEKINPVLIKP